VQIAAPYWVVGLGPPTYGNDGLYEFAIVSDPFELSLFVLARNVTEYYTRWNATVWNLLDTLGFTGLNSPIPTVWDGCTPFKA
jgi:lipocalin